MSISGFKIEKQKAIKLAECTSVPKVMVIAGPNGVGKSTLLYELQQKKGVTFTGDTQIFYQGPHRALRRTQVTQRSLFGSSIRWFRDVIMGNSVPSFEGFNSSNLSRTPDNVDDAGSTIKHILGQIENQKSIAQNQLLDNCRKRKKTLDPAQLPDIYQPLAKLTEYLLPHLKFDRVEFGNGSDIKCFFKRTDKQSSIELDIDELSSGEKSIVILFFPLIENEINHYLNLIPKFEEGASTPVPPVAERVMIIDEPEVHLHPELQARIMTYLRNVARTSNTQFIVSTHSPTILDQALDEELYLMLPPSVENENQIKRVANSIERLEGLKQIAGDAYLLTTGRSIVCIEGVKSSRTPTDLRLLEILYPRSTAFTFVPTGGKGQVIDFVGRLREFLPQETFKLNICGITDKDRSGETAEKIFPLPVCMIENLLLADLDQLLSYLQSIGVTDFADTTALQNGLEDIVNSLKEEEIELRVSGGIKGKTVRFKGATVPEIKANLEAEIQELQGKISDEKVLQEKINIATTEVETLIKDKKALEAFRGKMIIDSFYEKYIQPKGKSHSQFTYELAAAVAKGTKVQTILDPLFESLSK